MQALLEVPIQGSIALFLAGAAMHLFATTSMGIFIGITPFIAGLEALAGAPRDGAVDLIYSTNAPAEAFIERIRQLAGRAGARFHLWLTPKDGFLTLDHLERMIPDWKDADVWFCGPLRFGHSLRDAMATRGFPPARFHHELFDMS